MWDLKLDSEGKIGRTVFSGYKEANKKGVPLLKKPVLFSKSVNKGSKIMNKTKNIRYLFGSS